MIPSMDDLKRYMEAAYNAPWWLLSAAFSFVVCVGLRRWEKYPNKAIPLTCLALAALMTCITAPKAPSSATKLGWYATNLAIGGILGFLVWGVHNKILQPLSIKFPWLGSILTGEDDAAPAPLPPPPKTP